MAVTSCLVFVEDLEFAEGRGSVTALHGVELRLSKLKQSGWCWWQVVWCFRAKAASVYRFVGTEKSVHFPDLFLVFSKRCFL